MNSAVCRTCTPFPFELRVCDTLYHHLRCSLYSTALRLLFTLLQVRSRPTDHLTATLGADFPFTVFAAPDMKRFPATIVTASSVLDSVTGTAHHVAARPQTGPGRHEGITAVVCAGNAPGRHGDRHTRCPPYDADSTGDNTFREEARSAGELG